jgi:hypothetical protein
MTVWQQVLTIRVGLTIAAATISFLHRTTYRVPRPLSISDPIRLRFDDFELDEANAWLLRGGQAVALAPTPFSLLRQAHRPVGGDACARRDHPHLQADSQGMTDRFTPGRRRHTLELRVA